MKRKRWAFGILLGALALGLTACAGGTFRLPGDQRIQQQPIAAALERKSGRIVYVGTDGNIYVTDQGGVQQTPLTSDAQLTDDFYHIYRLPTWSPDGTQVAFVGESGTPGDISPTGTILYTVDREGGILTETYNSQENRLFFLYWSPDGKFVSFLTSHSDPRLIELQAVTADGSDQPFVLGAGAPVYLSWAPDSESVLIHSESVPRESLPPASILSAVQLGGSTSAEETLPYEPGDFQAPAWSQDGEKTLFATTTDLGADALVVADAAGGNPRVVTEYEGRTAFGWSADDRYLAYITSAEESPLSNGPFGVLGPLHVYDLQTSEAIRIDEEENVLAFFWSPNGKRLAYFVPAIVQNEDTGEQSVALSMKIAVARSGEVYELFRFQPPPEFLQTLYLFDQYNRSATIWSPDGQNVVFAAVEGDQDFIAVMHASGSVEPRGIAEGTVAFWSQR